MAITRATGRVYRNNFAWLIKLAGFEPLPAEEMPEPAKKVDPSYDPSEDHHKRFLISRCRAAGVENTADWTLISRAMVGHRHSETDAIIADYKEGKTV